MALIFYLSNQPFLSSGLKPSEDFILRKFAHISEFFILTILFYRAVKKTIFENPVFAAAIFSLLYAVSDEVHQLFVPGRAGKIEDVMIDGVGILAAAAVLWGKE